MADFTLKQNDTSPAIQARLKNKDGTTVTLTGATVRFSMRHRVTNNLKVNRATATIVSATPPADTSAANVEYTWIAADTDIDGTYDAEWEVTYSAGAIQSFPDFLFNEIIITKQIA